MRGIEVDFRAMEGGEEGRTGSSEGKGTYSPSSFPPKTSGPTPSKQKRVTKLCIIFLRAGLSLVAAPLGSADFLSFVGSLFSSSLLNIIPYYFLPLPLRIFSLSVRLNVGLLPFSCMS